MLYSLLSYKFTRNLSSGVWASLRITTKLWCGFHTAQLTQSMAIFTQANQETYTSKYATNAMIAGKHATVVRDSNDASDTKT